MGVRSAQRDVRRPVRAQLRADAARTHERDIRDPAERGVERPAAPVGEIKRMAVNVDDETGRHLEPH